MTKKICVNLILVLVEQKYPWFSSQIVGENSNESAKMGNEVSMQMEMASNFDAEEIKRLGKRFKKLDLVQIYH